MRLMAEHKYGVRITSLPGWEEFFQKLGEAAVTIHLLQNKPQHTTVIKLDDPTSSSVKGIFFGDFLILFFAENSYYRSFFYIIQLCSFSNTIKRI